MAFPDIAKASGTVKRVFSVIDRQPGINPNTGTGVACAPLAACKVKEPQVGHLA